MAYIQSWQELGQHPKTKRLARLLGVPRVQVVGHLHYLWWWALDYAQSGCLNGYTADEIAEESLREGDPEQFVAALVDCRVQPDGAGFLEKDENGVLWLHDWADYAGKLILHRRLDAIRKTSERRTQVVALDVLGTSEGCPRDGARRQDKTREEVEKLNTCATECPARGSIAPGDVSESPSPPSASPAKPAKKKRGSVDSGEGVLYSDEFEHCWALYPRHVDKQRAYDAFAARLRSGGDLALLMQACDNYAAECAERATEEKYVMYPSNFLGAKAHWMDYVQRKTPMKIGALPRGIPAVRAVAARRGVV